MHKIDHPEHVDVTSSTMDPLRTSAIPTLNLSHVTNSMVFDGDLPPAESTPVPTIRTLQHDNMTAATASSDPLWDEIDASPPTLEAPASAELTSSLIFLKQALDLAQQEVATLRRRCRELEDLHATGEDPQSRTITKQMGNDPSILLPALPHMHGIDQPVNPTPTPTGSDIDRALEMVRFIDELVWKRSRFGAEHDNPYGADNIQMLRERLELWEQVVRTRR